MGVEPLDFRQFIDWAFLAMLTGAIGFAVKLLGDFAKNFKKLGESVTELNQKISVVVEKMAWHEQWLMSHDGDIKEIRNKLTITIKEG